jgi:hypothetical protein
MPIISQQNILGFDVAMTNGLGQRVQGADTQHHIAAGGGEE